MITKKPEIIETVDKEWIVLVDGVQWGPIGIQRDKSGCADTTFGTKNEAIRCLIENEKRINKLWKKGK